MQSLGVTKFKKLNPRKGYLAPYIKFPWNQREDLIGREVEILQTDDGFHIRFVDEEFKQDQTVTEVQSSSSVEKRLSNLERKFKQISSILKSKPKTPFNDISTDPPHPQTSTSNINTGRVEISKPDGWARGLVGYDVALTRRRSPVRIRPSPFQRGQNWTSPQPCF